MQLLSILGIFDVQALSIISIVVSILGVLALGFFGLGFEYFGVEPS